MKKFIPYLIKHKDTAILSVVFILLLLALMRPSIPIRHNIYNYFLIADISQSMNASDMQSSGKTVTRIAHTQQLMHEITSSLPCGTKVSIGLFAGNSVAALYTPIEVCANFAAIQDTIDHLDWRTAWSGNSRLRESLYGAARTVRSFPEPAQVVYFTDGEEAPKLHAFNTKNLVDFQGADDWLLVGIGTEKGVAIPKLSDKNQVIGYWSNDSFALQPGIAQISESTLGTRDDSIALGDQDRFISKHNPEYMKSVAKEIGAKYIYGDNAHSIIDAMHKQKPAKRDIAPFNIHWVFAALAALFLLSAYYTRHPIQQILSTLKLYKKELQARYNKNEAAIAHDNQLSNL